VFNSVIFAEGSHQIGPIELVFPILPISQVNTGHQNTISVHFTATCSADAGNLPYILQLLAMDYLLLFSKRSLSQQGNNFFKF
jgi:hypothetical protein